MRWRFFKTEARRRRTKDTHPSSVIRPSSEIRCPLCGKAFHAREAKQCVTCGLADKCGLVMCPNCSYEFAP